MLKLAFLNLFRFKSRTFLAMLGIIIGVAAIISLVSVVDGLFAEITNAVGQVQGIRVLRSGGDPVFSRIDASFESELEKVNGVSVVVPLVTGPISSIDGKSLSFGNSRIIGIDFSKQEKSRTNLAGGEILEGREIRANESGVAVIGESIKKDFGKFLNQNIVVNGKKLRIVGVYSAGSSLLNSTVLVPIADAREMLNFPTDKVSGFNLELVNPEDDKKVVGAINFRFKGDLRAFSVSDLSAQFGEILGSFRLLVVAVAAISAIVAAVGIINTMLMSVLERFKEIGALKAVGWSNFDVVKIIFLESVLISFFGAIIGIFVGFLVSVFIESAFGLQTLITLGLVLQVFLFAFFIGIIGAAYPAVIASKMDPVEALRFE